MPDHDFTPESYRDTPVSYPALQVMDLARLAGDAPAGYQNLVLNRVNGHCLRFAAFDGDYPWHHHPSSDELFLVLEGTLLIDLADGTELRLGPWQAATVPAGTVHRTRTVGRTVNLCFEELAADTVFTGEPHG